MCSREPEYKSKTYHTAKYRRRILQLSNKISPAHIVLKEWHFHLILLFANFKILPGMEEILTG